MLITNNAVFESCFVVGRFTLGTEILPKIWEADARMRNLLNHQCSTSIPLFIVSAYVVAAYCRPFAVMLQNFGLFL